MQPKQVVIDTSAFFAGTKKLSALLDKGTELSTIDLVVFEFTKVMEDEIGESSGRKRRLELLRGLRERFPKLLRDLEIEVLSPEFSSADVDSLYSIIAEGYDPGDAMIWLKMRRAGLETILTDNVSDWRDLGATVITFE